MDDITLLIQSFDNLSNPNQEIRDPANEYIESLVQSSPMHFLFLSSKIIQIDDLPDSIYRMAFTLMGHTLTPSLIIPIQMIESTFLDPINNDERSLIKEASFRGLMFTDQVIRQQASYCVFLIFQMEKDQWSELFPSLFEIASSNTSQYSIEAHCGAIYCFKNIIQSDIFTDQIVDFIENFYSLIIHFLSTSEIESENFYDECFECYVSILCKLVENSKIDEEIALKCFEIVDKSIDAFGIAKSNICLTALFSIFKGIYYTSIFDHIDKYLDISKQILQDGDLDQQIDVLFRWEEIAKFEQEQEDSQKIIDSISESFFPVILNFISTGIQSSDDINDLFNPDPSYNSEDTAKQTYNAGCNCLASFYTVAPESIFSYITELWSFEDLSDQDQVISALFSLQSIIKKDPEFDPLIKFIENDINEIVLKMTESDNMLIAILSLILIRKSVKKFGCFIRGESQVEILLFELQKCAKSNTDMIFYCCHVMNSIFRRLLNRIYTHKLSGFEDSIENSIVAQCFDQFLEILNYFLSLTESSRNIISAFGSFTFFIHLIPTSQLEITLDIQENVIKKTIIQTLSNPDDYPEDILFSLQDSAIGMIAAIADRLNVSEIKLTNADELIRLLFTLANQQKTEVYDETLIAFDSIVFCIGDDFGPYAEEMMDLILVMLRIGSPGIVENAIHIISELFRILKDFMEPYADPVFKLMIPMIYNENYNRELVVGIVGTLADVVKSTPNIESESKIEFYNVLVQLTKTIKIDPSNRKEIKFINNFFEAAFYAFANLNFCSLEDQFFLEINYNETYRGLVDLYIDFSNFVSNQGGDENDPAKNGSIFGFFLFIQSLATMYGRSLMRVLNNRKIRRLIEYQMQNKQNADLKEIAERTYEKIKRI